MLDAVVHRFNGLGLTEGPSHQIGARWRSAAGTARSLVIYYGNPIRSWRMDRLYSRFVRRGDLIFDIGSHVGNRIGSFRRLGCRVVAVEPQPSLVRILRRFYGRDPDVAIVPPELIPAWLTRDKQAAPDARCRAASLRRELPIELGEA